MFDTDQNRFGLETDSPDDDLIIVGIGASAGGLSALQELLPVLPSHQRVAYVIAQHLAPKGRSALPALLAKHTRIPIAVISDGAPVQPNRIYVTPPNYDVILKGACFRLRTAASIGPKPSIDVFFNSLAVEKQSRAVGIILSGTGSDGAHGIRAIKSHEGITMAQTSASAKFYGMPQAAMETGFIDLVLPPGKIGQALESTLTYPRWITGAAPPDPSADAIDTIVQILLEQTGVDFKPYQPAIIDRRIRRRMAILNLPKIKDYINHVQGDSQELAVLSRDMSILATRFFRNHRAFEVLTDHVRDLLEGKQPGDSIRIWVPGCSSGEEAYSIAILLADLLGDSIGQYNVQLFATDIDDTSIQLARRGGYALTALADDDMQRFGAYFDRCENTITVKKRIRDMVVLARQDVMKDAPFLHLDLISCRNLLTSLNPGMQVKLLALFHYVLNPKGLLFLGRSESINGQTDLFGPENRRWKIYRRSEMPVRGLPELMRNRHTSQLAWREEQYGSRANMYAWNVKEFMASLVNLFDSSCVLTDAHLNILFVQGDVSPYFKFPEGRVAGRFNAIDIARSRIRPTLQSLLYKAARQKQAMTSNAISLGGNQTHRGVRIKVGPLPAKQSEGCQVIVFTPVEMPATTVPPDAASEPADFQRIAQLEQALAETREQLQDTVEALETSTENMETLNEELQTANEELQATNEELETSNEELQASNEELSTVNDELRAKSEETEALLEDLRISERRNQLLVDELNLLVKRRTAALETTVEALQETAEEQRLAEEKLRRLSKVFMDSSDPIIIEDLDTTIQDANRAAEEAYGFSRAELIGQSIRKLIPAKRHASAEELRRRCLAGETIRNWEGIRRDRNGGHQPVLVTAFALTGGHGQPESIATIAKDIAKIKELQQEMERRAHQLARLTSELTLAEQRERRRLARVLHDHLQQLLAGAKLKLEMLRDEQAETGNSELQSALQMIMESLKASRSLSAELSPPILYQHGLDKALEWLARWMGETHGLQVDLNLDPAAAPAKEELKILLFESVRELLFNVVKHAKTRSARVDMICHGNLSRIIVSDAGSGFDPESLRHGELDDEMGFGLINIRERLQLIGGAFEIQSQPGKGTTIILTAPMQKTVCTVAPGPENNVKSAAGRLVQPIAARQSARTRPGKIRVLLVDDHAVMRNGLSVALSKFGGIKIVGQAADGQEAVMLARKTRPEVILMDINMPKMNGVEATRAISAELPGTRIYALSMYDAEDQEAQMIEAGAVGYLNKGGSMEELLAAILQTETVR